MTWRRSDFAYPASNIDHILVPADLVGCFDNGNVIDVDPKLSDHSIIFVDCHLPEQVPIVISAKYRLKAFESDNKKIVYETKCCIQLLNAQLLIKAQSIESKEHCETVLFEFEKNIKRALNESIGKHSPKNGSLFSNLPSLFATKDIHTIEFKDFQKIFKQSIEYNKLAR